MLKKNLRVGFGSKLLIRIQQINLDPYGPGSATLIKTVPSDALFYRQMAIAKWRIDPKTLRKVCIRNTGTDEILFS